jgi:hypothetical protein
VHRICRPCVGFCGVPRLTPRLTRLHRTVDTAISRLSCRLDNVSWKEIEQRRGQISIFPLPPPATIGKCRIQRVLGTGEMGTVTDCSKPANAMINPAWCWISSSDGS